MSTRVYVLRQEMSEGEDFEGERPAEDGEEEALVETFEGRASAGWFVYDDRLFYDLRRITLQFEDATSFEIGLRHSVDLGESDDPYETVLMEWEEGDVTFESDLVDSHVRDGRAVLHDIGYMLLIDESVYVETSGVGNDVSVWAEVASVPVRTSASDSFSLPP